MCKIKLCKLPKKSNKYYMYGFILTGCGTVVIPACGFKVAKASLAAVTSLLSLAMTLQAASC